MLTAKDKYADEQKDVASLRPAANFAPGSTREIAECVQRMEKGTLKKPKGIFGMGNGILEIPDGTNETENGPRKIAKGVCGVENGTRKIATYTYQHWRSPFKLL